MICNEAAEYASALCDGETIPPDAAEHIGRCELCQARIHDYVAMGVELRRVASLEAAAKVPARAEMIPPNKLAKWWQKGWGTMRIPRLAFAALLMGIITLGSALAVVKVRAHDTGTVILLSTVGSDERTVHGLPAEHFGQEPGLMLLGYGRWPARSLNTRSVCCLAMAARVLLGIRTRSEFKAPGTRSYSPFELDNEPAREVWLEPGEPVKSMYPMSALLRYRVSGLITCRFSSARINRI